MKMSYLLWERRPFMLIQNLDKPRHVLEQDQCVFWTCLSIRNTTIISCLIIADAKARQGDIH